MLFVSTLLDFYRRCLIGRTVVLIVASSLSSRLSPHASLRFIIGHITPEAQAGGPIALLKDDDPIVIDAENRTISVLISSVSSGSSS